MIQETGLSRPFWPALKANERREYYEIASPSAISGSELDPTVAQAADLLRWCDALVLVYPTWWFNVPASVKGFFDRVFIPHVAFTLPEASKTKTSNTGLVPLLTNVKKVGVVTTYGAPKHIAIFAGDNGRQMISRAIRPLFAKDCPMVWMGLYNLHFKTYEERKAFLGEVENRFREF